MAGTLISKELLSEQHNIMLSKQLLTSDILLKPDKLKKIPEKLDVIMLKLVNLEVFKIYIESTLNCAELKELIFKFLSQTLQPKDMILKAIGRRIKDEQIIGNIISVDSLIIQEKLPLKELESSEYFSKIEDDFTLEKGVVKMKCGHLMGRQSMIELLKVVVNQKKYKIVCPHPDCLVQWTYQECKQVGCFTKEENKTFVQGLQRNFHQVNSIQCPGCRIFVAKEKNTKRLVCTNPKCKLKTFCGLCLKKWESPAQSSCSNVCCSFASEFFNQTKTKPFRFYDPNAVRYFQMQIPTHRLCPGCYISIQHSQGCKHITCSNCQTKFCFVCLEVFEKKWNCGGFNWYCGKIAEKQKLI